MQRIRVILAGRGEAERAAVAALQTRERLGHPFEHLLNLLQGGLLGGDSLGQRGQSNGRRIGRDRQAGLTPGSADQGVRDGQLAAQGNKFDLKLLVGHGNLLGAMPASAEDFAFRQADLMGKEYCGGRTQLCH